MEMVIDARQNGCSRRPDALVAPQGELEVRHGASERVPGKSWSPSCAARASGRRRAVAVVRAPPGALVVLRRRLERGETLVCALATVSVLATVQGLSSSRLGFGRRGIVCGSRRCFWLQ